MGGAVPSEQTGMLPAPLGSGGFGWAGPLSGS